MYPRPESSTQMSFLTWFTKQAKREKKRSQPRNMHYISSGTGDSVSIGNRKGFLFKRVYNGAEPVTDKRKDNNTDKPTSNKNQIVDLLNPMTLFEVELKRAALNKLNRFFWEKKYDEFFIYLLSHFVKKIYCLF